MHVCLHLCLCVCVGGWVCMCECTFGQRISISRPMEYHVGTAARTSPLQDRLTNYSRLETQPKQAGGLRPAAGARAAVRCADSARRRQTDRYSENLVTRQNVTQRYDVTAILSRPMTEHLEEFNACSTYSRRLMTEIFYGKLASF